MKILALESYYGGSHRAFLDGWIDKSRHDWCVLTLPPNKWKWRMRHGAITFAQQVNDLVAKGEKWDALFCSDMLNLAEFIGLVNETVRKLPRIVYFHENQLTYPVRFESERDCQYVLTNMTTALAASEVWFNSAFHRDEFLTELTKFLKRMPDNQPIEEVEIIRKKTHIHPPGIETPPQRSSQRKPGPMRLLWVARWEHDKNPEDFFEAVKRLKENNINFRLSVIGEQFRDMPEVFTWAKEYFADNIDRWGYQPSKEEYLAALTEADVVISTADHEFFGISVVEAIAAGAYPVLPRRLAYPEVLSNIETLTDDEFMYDGSVEGLVNRLTEIAGRVNDNTLWHGKPNRGRDGVKRFCFDSLTKTMDNAIEKCHE